MNLLKEETEEAGPPSTEDTGRRQGGGEGRGGQGWGDGVMTRTGGGKRMDSGSETEGGEETRERGRQKGRLRPAGVRMRGRAHTRCFGGFAAS